MVSDILDHPVLVYSLGIDPMGLFWSLAASSGQGEGVRLVKKDVSVPLLYTIQVLKVTSEHLPLRNVLAETTVEKLYMKKGVRRVTVNEGPLRGTVFIPEGNTYVYSDTCRFSQVARLNHKTINSQTVCLCSCKPINSL